MQRDDKKIFYALLIGEHMKVVSLCNTTM